MALTLAEVESLLRPGWPAEQLVNSGLSEEQIAFIEITPFPDARRRWLAGIEERIRGVLDDERAAVMARMLVANREHVALGEYRREIRVEREDWSRAPGNLTLRIKELDAEGSFIREDVGPLTAGDESRWGHLFDFTELRAAEPE